MADTQQRDQSVRLNEAFERLEKNAAPRSESASSPVGGLAMLLALIAIGIASYATWMILFKQPAAIDAAVAGLRANVSELSREVQARDAQVAALKSQLAQVNTKLDEAGNVKQADLDALTTKMEQRLAELKSSMGTSSKDWIYAEVEYLLRLANQRVVMEGNVKGALALFHAADNILRDAEGITAFDLRQAIANNITRLEAVQQVDVDGIFVKLAALASEVSQLKQRQQSFEAAAPVLTPVPSEASFTDKVLALLRQGGQRLATLVDYRRNGEHIKPILPPREEYYLRQNLVLKLQMAELALLRGDQPVYETSLSEAQSWVVEHFDPDDVATTAMLKSLAELGAIKVNTPMPDVSSSLKEVRKLLAGFHQAAARDQSEVQQP